MQIVIDIPKKNYEEIINNGMMGSHLAPLYEALYNGMPLQKWFKKVKESHGCPKCGGRKIIETCDSHTHIFGFYKVWKCEDCEYEWTYGSGI